MMNSNLSPPPTYADVALPVAVDKTFTYLIPPELERSAVVGVRAIVPFGRKYATGVIVGLPPQTTLKSLKPIKDIVDASPVLSDELLRLCTWMAEYYFAPLGEVLKAAFPSGFASSSKRRVWRNPLVTDAEVAELKARAPKRWKLLSLLSQHGPMLSADLQKRVGVKNIHATLNEMTKTGLVQTEEIVPHPTQKPKTQEIVQLATLEEERMTSDLGNIPPRQKKARQLLEELLLLKRRWVPEITVRDLAKKTGASTAAIRKLSQSGAFTIDRQEITRGQEFGTEEQTRTIVLNAVQRQVLDVVAGAITGGAHKTFLLHGVTGSGKTQVYIEAIRECLRLKKTAIVLVPEISLTPQIVRRFKSHFADQVAVVHSRMSAGERHDVWRHALGGQYSIVIGPRSALFAPLSNLGLIVVDEEHEASYKQFDSTPRYHARDAAIVRGSLAGAVVLLGSATPSAESYFNATTAKYTLLEMQERIDHVPMPSITIVDMTAERKREYAATRDALPDDRKMKLREFQQSSLSEVLKRKIDDRLSRKEGIILLQNRRGFAPFVECMDCGYSESCENCNVTLTYHLAKKHLRCHYCGMVRAPHAFCPTCASPNLQLHGIGTQKVEQELAALFPEATVARMDLDTTSRKGAHDRILKKFGAGETDILLGTQMVAKGLDFGRVTLVGVVSADTQMLLPDFRSSERTFQLLTQVAGRAGRSTLRGEVIIQTHQPKHYTLQHVVDHDFQTFYSQELEARKELDYPPFSRLALIELKGENEDRVHQEAERFGELLKGRNGSFGVLGPSPAVLSKINNQYRWHIIIKDRKADDPSGSRLRHSLRTARQAFDERASRTVRLIIDIDPVGLM